MRALHTDLYELTMAAGYFAAGKVQDRAVFEMFVRRLPPEREYLIAAGLPQAVEYLVELRFEEEQVRYLRQLAQLAHTPEEFWDYLRGFRFTGDVFALPEGTPFFAGEPVITVQGPLIEAQIAETYLLATLGFQSMIASKASRIVAAAAGRTVVEFGARRAHGAEAGVLAGRAAYIGGCAGTSNVEAGHRFGIPVFGTSAHSWVLAFDTEREAFAALQRLLGEGTVYLIDSFDTIDGARTAVSLGPPMWGVRLDSGDLTTLARETRRILDKGGFGSAKIMATSDLNEDRIARLVAAGAPIDAFGVGTELATSFDAPALSAVYKLVEHEAYGNKRPVAKYSPDKATYPGAKQVYRFPDRDVIGTADECSIDVHEALPLLRPVLVGGQLVEPLPSASDARSYCAEALSDLSSGHRVEYSGELLQLAEEHNRRFA